MTKNKLDHTEGREFTPCTQETKQLKEKRPSRKAAEQESPARKCWVDCLKTRSRQSRQGRARMHSQADERQCFHSAIASDSTTRMNRGVLSLSEPSPTTDSLSLPATLGKRNPSLQLRSKISLRGHDVHGLVRYPAQPSIQLLGCAGYDPAFPRHWHSFGFPPLSDRHRFAQETGDLLPASQNFRRTSWRFLDHSLCPNPHARSVPSSTRENPKHS